MAGLALKPAALSSAQRSALYRALARLQDAGLPADRAVAALGDLLGSGHARRFRSMSAFLAGGSSLTEAGRRAGLFSTRDHRLIAVAEASGSLAKAAAMLADSYAFRARVLGKFRSRMLLPLLVLTLGLLLLPLPSVVAGKTGAGTLVWSVFAPLAVLVALAGAGAWTVRRASAWGVPAIVGRLGLAVPVLAPVLALTHRLQLVEGLALLLEAGVPARDALEAALNAVANPVARRRYAPALARLGAGSLSDALNGAGALAADEFAIVSASEAAGRVVDGLERTAGKLRGKLESRLELTSEWLPRAVYLLLVLIIAGGLIG